MGRRKIIVKQTAADNIAAISWYIESQGLMAIADKFADDVYDYFIKIADDRDHILFAGIRKKPY